MTWVAAAISESSRGCGTAAQPARRRWDRSSLPQPPPLVVAVPGTGLVPAAPGRPAQVMADRVGRPAQGRVQAADLVHGQADHRLAVTAANRIVLIVRPQPGKLSTGWWPLSGPAACPRPAAGRWFGPAPAGGGRDRQPRLGAHGQ